MRNIFRAALAATALTAAPAMAETITVNGTFLSGTFANSPFGQSGTFTGVGSTGPVSQFGFDTYLLDSLSIFSGGVNYTFNATANPFYFYKDTSGAYNYSGLANGVNSNVIRFDNNTGAFINSNDGARFDVTNSSGTSFTGAQGVQFTGGSGITAAILPSNAIGAVPEPATWAMMIAGFGLVGGTMRRRSTKVAFA